VFASVIDPVGAGLVESLARPGGNTTGFIAFEYAIGAKWLELLKEIAPGVTRAAVLRDPAIAAGIGQFAAIQAAGSIGMELSVISTRGAAGAVENAVAAFARAALASEASGQRGNSMVRAPDTRPEPGSSARASNGGLVVTGSPFAANNVGPIAALAARHKLPTVYPFRYFVSGGGLISYGPDLADQFRNAAGYVDRILRGEKAEDLPVQAPTKYELVVNLKTAKTLGLEAPPTLLARADEVIE
jgi:putative ABC transport system substrate-binding protein